MHVTYILTDFLNKKREYAIISKADAYTKLNICVVTMETSTYSMKQIPQILSKLNTHTHKKVNANVKQLQIFHIQF